MQLHLCLSINTFGWPFNLGSRCIGVHPNLNVRRIFLPIYKETNNRLGSKRTQSRYGCNSGKSK